MDNEKTLIEESVQDTSVEDSNTVKEESSVQEVETYSKADYEKAIQSASSKAKNEILKSLGINSVKEFQELKNTYQTAINEKTTLEENISNLNKENTKLQENLLLSKLGVSEEYSNDLLTLAKSKVDENHSLEQVSRELLEKYPEGYFPEDEYAKYIQELQPTWYVLPDKRDDGFGTIDVVNEWFKNHKDLSGKTIGVVHGHTFDEMQMCYNHLDGVCDKLAFSFESWWFDYAKENNIPISNIRYEIIKHLNINTNKPHHLLGCILPNEFKLWKDISWIETIDTSAPITNAIENKLIQPEMTEKPKTTIHGSFTLDYSEEISNRMIHNTGLFKNYYVNI